MSPEDEGGSPRTAPFVVLLALSLVLVWLASRGLS